MTRRVRRAQFGAGISAGVLGTVGLGALLFAPLVRGCVVDVSFTSVCPPRAVRYVSLPQAGLGADAWALLLGLFIVVLAGAAGAILDARREWLPGDPARWAIPLWAATLLSFGACALAARGIVGLAYLPAVLALCLAASASLARRQPMHPAATTAPAAPATTDADPATVPAHDETRADASPPADPSEE